MAVALASQPWIFFFVNVVRQICASNVRSTLTFWEKTKLFWKTFLLILFVNHMASLTIKLIFFKQTLNFSIFQKALWKVKTALNQLHYSFQNFLLLQICFSFKNYFERFNWMSDKTFPKKLRKVWTKNGFFLANRVLVFFWTMAIAGHTSPPFAAHISPAKSY